VRVDGQNGKQHWWSVISSSRFTHYQVHRARGQLAMVANGFLLTYRDEANPPGERVARPWELLPDTARWLSMILP
jgi:hypothetical protein